MSDNIFNYFSSKGTRKVDPIDDAEFDSIDSPPAPSDSPSQLPTQDLAQDSAKDVVPAVVASTGMDSRGNTPKSTAPSEPKPVPPEPKKTQSNWDYLASLLGIKKESTQSTPEEQTIPVVAEKQEKPKTRSGREVNRPSRSGRVETTQQEPVQEEAILNSLFLASDSASESVDTQTDKFREPEISSEDESDLEYVEFEVEDLDKSADSDDSERKSRRVPARPSEGRSRENQSRRGSEHDRPPGRHRQDSQRSSEGTRSSSDRPSRGDRDQKGSDQGGRDRQGQDQLRRDPHGRDRQSRDSHGRDSHGRDLPSRDSQGLDRKMRDELNPSAQQRREPVGESDRNPRKEKSQDKDSFRRTPAAEAPVASSFGSGIFEDSPARGERGEIRGVEDRYDEESPRAEGEAPRRKRRRRPRGRDSSRETAAGLPRHTALPEIDPPDDFFDEVGWQPTQPTQPARQVRSETSHNLSDDELDASFGDEETPFSAVKEDESELGDRTGRKRRRRRPRSRRESAEPNPSNLGMEADFDSRPSGSSDRSDVDKDESDYDQAHRNPRQHRQPAAGRTADRNQDDEGQSSAEHPKKDRKFPTWEEAISVLVESNIKNHSRSSGQNRSGNRGRRRR